MTGSNGSYGSVRVLVVEPTELVRRGICDVLTRQGEPFEVAGEISSVDELTQACRTLTPDVIVLSLPNDGEHLEDLAMLRRALEAQPAARAIVLLGRDRIDDIIGSVRAGAAGVLLREASAGTLLAAFHDVLAGGAALDPGLARSLFNRLVRNGGGGEEAGETVMDPAIAGALSRREREVLQALARGSRNKEISAQLGVSVGTVKTHLRHIFRKLHVADRTSAALIALQGKLPKVA